MPSSISRIQPRNGDRNPQVEIRNNFGAAANDIEALQELQNLKLTGSIAAAGNSLATATLLGTGISIVSTSTATSADCVRLPSSTAGDVYIVHNASANTINCYPPSGGTINGGSAGAAVTLAAGKARVFYATATATFFSMLGA